MDTMLFVTGALFGITASVKMFRSIDDEEKWTMNACMLLAAAILMKVSL